MGKQHYMCQTPDPRQNSKKKKLTVDKCGKSYDVKLKKRVRRKMEWKRNQV